MPVAEGAAAAGWTGMTVAGTVHFAAERFVVVSVCPGAVFRGGGSSRCTPFP